MTSDSKPKVYKASLLNYVKAIDNSKFVLYICNVFFDILRHLLFINPLKITIMKVIKLIFKIFQFLGLVGQIGDAATADPQKPAGDVKPVDPVK